MVVRGVREWYEFTNSTNSVGEAGRGGWSRLRQGFGGRGGVLSRMALAGDGGEHTRVPLLYSRIYAII
jgi:hypothetical protein